MHVCKISLNSLKISTVRQGLPVPIILPYGNGILLGSLYNNKFLRWEIPTFPLVHINAGHPADSIVTSIDITSNGEFALTGSSSGTLSLVDIECSKIVQTFPKTESGVAIRFVCVLSDDIRFVFVDEANRIELRTFYNEVRIELGRPDAQVTCITGVGFNYTLVGCDDGEVSWFHLNNKSQSHKFRAHRDAISQVRGEQFSSERRILRGFSSRFASGSIGGSVKLWNVEENLPTLIWSHDNIYSNSITALAFLPFSDDIIIGCDGKLDRINASGIVHTFYRSSRYVHHRWRIESIRVVGNSVIGLFSMNHILGFTLKRNLKVVKGCLSYNTLTSVINESLDTFNVLRINNSCNVVAISAHDSLMIWNFITGTVLHRLPIKDITVLALSPGGEYLLSNSLHDKTLKLWKLANGECVEEFHFDRDVSAIACTSNGTVCVGLKGGRVSFLRFQNLSSDSKQIELG